MYVFVCVCELLLDALGYPYTTFTGATPRRLPNQNGDEYLSIRIFNGLWFTY